MPLAPESVIFLALPLAFPRRHRHRHVLLEIESLITVEIPLFQNADT